MVGWVRFFRLGPSEALLKTLAQIRRQYQESFRNYILQFKGNPYIKGIRHGLNNQNQLEDNRLIRNLRLLGSLNMSFDLLVPPRLIGQAAKLVERCGDTRFILDHCGNADPLAFNHKLDWGRKPQHDVDQWKHNIDMLAKQKNVICKISVQKVVNFIFQYV